VSGRAAFAGVIGHPVGHSLSPRLHGHWLGRYRLDGAYLPFDVAPGNLETALRGLAVLGGRGCNITLPHKEAACGLMDELQPGAARIGAVNTVVIGPGGGLIGSNTDGFGFLENLRAGAPAWSASARPAVVIGAGGAARAIVAALTDAGCPGIRLVNRTLARAEAMAAELGGPVDPVAWDACAPALDGAGLLVNTTSLGMTGQPPLDLALDSLPTDAVVTDIVYAPLQTPLLTAARARGNPVVDGLGMLLHQARPGFEAWFGVKATVDAVLRQALLEGR
jgi:shikimate dehydrogenase